jgi:hypothetical protein
LDGWATGGWPLGAFDFAAVVEAFREPQPANIATAIPAKVVAADRIRGSMLMALD